MSDFPGFIRPPGNLCRRGRSKPGSPTPPEPPRRLLLRQADKPKECPPPAGAMLGTSPRSDRDVLCVHHSLRKFRFREHFGFPFRRVAFSGSYFAAPVGRGRTSRISWRGSRASPPTRCPELSKSSHAPATPTANFIGGKSRKLGRRPTKRRGREHGKRTAPRPSKIKARSPSLPRPVRIPFPAARRWRRGSRLSRGGISPT